MSRGGKESKLHGEHKRMSETIRRICLGVQVGFEAFSETGQGGGGTNCFLKICLFEKRSNYSSLKTIRDTALNE